jgi:hypothetical protein
MNDFFGVTDNDWFMILSHKPEIGEINFYVMWRLGYLTEITASPKPLIRESDHTKRKTCDKEDIMD